MAAVTVLDASVLIAHLDADDVQHAAAGRLLEDTADSPLLSSTLTLAQVLVGPSRRGTNDKALSSLRTLGVTSLAIEAGAAERLAQLRARTGLHMPDCCVLLAAEQEGAGLVTLDQRLADAARTLGITVCA